MDTEVLCRVVAAAALAGVIGVEREAVGQPAGLRTHVTVAIGACLFGIVSTLGFEEFFMRRELTNVQVDVTRVASNVVVGIGFLGAGLIIQRGGEVKNLTTAASLWATAAVGLAAGVGNVTAAAITTAALLGTFVLLRPLSHLIARRITRHRRRLRVEIGAGMPSEPVLHFLRVQPGVEVEQVEVHKRAGSLVVEVELRGLHSEELAEVYGKVAARPDVVSVDDPLT